MAISVTASWAVRHGLLTPEQRAELGKVERPTVPEVEAQRQADREERAAWDTEWARVIDDLTKRARKAGVEPGLAGMRAMELWNHELGLRYRKYDPQSLHQWRGEVEKWIARESKSAEQRAEEAAARAERDQSWRQNFRPPGR